MKASVDKLRWLLAGGSLFLLLLLVAVVGYGRYRAARLWKNRLDKLGVHIEQTTDNVTYSQTIQGRTVFTLRAGKAIQRKDGKTTLHNVQLTLYGKKDGSEDRIYGSEFEYDEKAGVARALGAVEMDLRVPGSLTKSDALNVTSQSSEHDIHVRTSGLTFVRKLGVAATDQQVLLSYAGLECTAKGAEFNAGESIIHLLADVDLRGTLRGKQIRLQAAKADLNHATNAVALSSPDLQSDGQTASATTALLQLRHDGSLDNVVAEGNVLLQKLTRSVTAARLESHFTAANVPVQASLTGGVKLVDADAQRPLHGVAHRVDGVFDGAGAPVRWKATGGAQLDTSARDAAGHPLSRSLRGDTLEASLKPIPGRSRSELTGVHVEGKAQLFAESMAEAGLKTTRLAADDLNAIFAAGATASQPVLQQVLGSGHTRFQQNGPGAAEQVSTGDRLQLRFGPDPSRAGQLGIENATQDGNVTFESHAPSEATSAKAREPISARADRSTYDGSTDTVVLTGSAQFTQGATSVNAHEFTANQRTGNSDAVGNVLATIAPAQGSKSEATHVRADRAHLDRASQVSTFRSTDEAPARLWQGASQVEAATITLDAKKHTLTARPEGQGAAVRAVFASAQRKTGDEAGGPGVQVERISASSMDYSDVSRAATFTGKVFAQGSTGQVRAQNAQMFFAPAPNTKPASSASGSLGAAPAIGGSLQKAVLWGTVQLSQPGKTGQGDRLVYTSADSTFLLTGTPSHPPQVVDAERGSVTGAALLFHSGDNKVVVSSSSGNADSNVRVHTETGAKQ